MLASDLVKDDKMAWVCHNLGSLYADEGKLVEAEQMYQQALQGYEKALGAAHASTLNTANNLGDLYADQGSLDVAEQMYQRALHGKEKALGAEHPLTLDTVNNLGVLYADQGKLDAAEQMYQRVLQVCMKALGANHISTLRTVNNLGLLYANQGKLIVAEQMYQWALKGYDMALGAEHPSTLDTVNNLGVLYADQGKLDGAEHMFERALRGKEKALGADHMSTLRIVNNLGKLYKSQGKFNAAEKMYQRALGGFEKTLSAKHKSTLRTANNLGNLYADQGSRDAAEQLYQRALYRKEKSWSPDHTSTLDTITHSGDLCADQLEEKLFTTDSLYSHRLTNFEFRIFVLEPGAIGSNITGTIQIFSLQNHPPYYALSYVWGPEPEIHQVIINGKAIFIRPNLFHALQRIRRTGQIHMWIDSLCINQFDDPERNAQVRQMATIYRNASSVLIWLGEEDSTSKFAMNFVPQMIESDFQWNGPWWEQYGFTALAHILARPWFRRGWVLQEAAFSTNSTIYCGDRQVHMNRFAMAVGLVRARLSSMPASFSRTASTMHTEILANFHDSPAVRLLNAIERAFRKSVDGDVVHHNMSLETLVDLGKFSETTDLRDTIYALVNMANDVASFSPPGQSDAIVPDYGKNVLDVFVDFILHCCCHSGSLDIICRPWAPVSSSAVYDTGQDNRVSQNIRKYPSWIASRDNLPFGNPSWRLNHRINGKSLVGDSQERIYNTHYGSKPHVSVGRNEYGTCDGSLYARGVVLGEVAQRSTRLASAIITKECLEILGKISYDPHSDSINLPDAIWRTLCADRDDRGGTAPPDYRLAMLQLLHIGPEIPMPNDSANLLEHMSSIDIEELLDTKIPDLVKSFLIAIRDVIWNRRTFRSKVIDGTERPLVGLIPQSAKVGDQVCILYGCSVPVVLRKLPSSKKELCWQLIGEAYVHGIMDGEALRSASLQNLKSVFEIQ